MPPRLRNDITRFEQKYFTDVFPTLDLARSGGSEELVDRLVQSLRPSFTAPRQVYGCPMRLPDTPHNTVFCTELVFISRGDISIMAPPPTSGFGSNAPPGSSECRGPCAGMVSTPSKRPSFLGSLSPLSPHSVGLTHSVSSVTASYTTVGQLKAGMWFGHRELLKGYDEYWNINPKQGEEQDENNGLAMTDVKWDLLYRCRTGCELLLLFKEDFWTLLDDIPTFRDLLEDQEDYGNLARASVHCVQLESDPEPLATLRYPVRVDGFADIVHLVLRPLPHPFTSKCAPLMLRQPLPLYSSKATVS